MHYQIQSLGLIHKTLPQAVKELNDNHKGSFFGATTVYVDKVGKSGQTLSSTRVQCIKGKWQVSHAKLAVFTFAQVLGK
jgi:hypothetical protein